MDADEGPQKVDLPGSGRIRAAYGSHYGIARDHCRIYDRIRIGKPPRRLAPGLEVGSFGRRKHGKCPVHSTDSITGPGLESG